MDSNPKSSAAFDATDSSVSSLALSVVQLEINVPSTDGGPINRLPNETMLFIVAKSDDGDGNKLARLRFVSTKWNSLVEHYCLKKTSLLVNCECFSNADLNLNCAPLSVRLRDVSHFGNMLKLFPNIEQLAVSFCRFDWKIETFKDDTQTRAFFYSINSLNCLKQLELHYYALKAVPHLSQTFSQLEHIGLFANSYNEILNAGDLRRFIRDIGPNCARLFIGLKLEYDQIKQFHKRKPNFLVNLTHLQMCTKRKSDRVLQLLAEHATSLEFLYIENCDELIMAPNVIRDLAKLVHLTELKISTITMDADQLDKAAARRRFTPLTSVLTCELRVRPVDPFDGDKFTRVLSFIFPNLINLNLRIAGSSTVNTLRRLSYLIEIKQNVHRFSNLRKHKITFN